LTISGTGAYFSGMTPLELTKEIGANRYRPVYYFYGEEDYRKAEALKYVLSNYLPQQQRLLNFSRLSIDKHDFGAICNEVAAMPMLGERRMVFVDEVQKLKPTQQKTFFAYLQNLPANLLIILSSPAAHSPDKKSAFLRDISQIAEPVKFDRLTSTAALTRIDKFLETAGLTCDKDAIDFLISITGGDYGGLMGELEKMSLSLEPGGHIGMAEVKAMVSSHEEFTIFELIDLVASKNIDRARYVCNDLMLRGEEPVLVMRLLSGHLMNLIKVHAGKKVAGHPFYVEKLRQQARNFDERRVLKAITLTAAAERDIRHSRTGATVILENLIREISR
jgi:DNA polymerase III subunit delta